MMTKNVTYARKCIVRLKCRVVNPRFHELQQLGVTNPALFAWEVIPFSFVFDWFVGVGDYLEGLTALHGIELLRSSQSFEKEMYFTRSAQMKQWIENGHTRHAPYFSRITGLYRAYQRVPITVDPLSLYPPFDINLNFKRLVDSLALMRSNARRFG